MRRLAYLSLFLTCALIIAAAPVFAQGGGEKKPVSADEVNNVAKKLYCPVCENIPLDTCGTAACADWREEIRLQLQSGKTEQEVIDDFVARFGDRVVGTPQDPTLRLLSLATPWLLSAAALLIALVIFARWRRELKRGGASLSAQIAPSASASAKPHTLEEYRTRIERDLAQRR